MINNKGGKLENLILSISQSMRKSLYNNIFDEANNRFGFLNITLVDLGDKLPGCLISALIYLIFATDYKAVLTNITNPSNTPIDAYQTELFTKIDGFTESDELKKIMKYSYLVMNNIAIPANINILAIYDKLDPREILVSMISKYYNSMEQPPQMQMVSDIIDLIRKKKDIDEIVDEELIINKFRHLIQTPITRANIVVVSANPENIINPNLPNMINNMKRSKYFTIIGNDDNASQIWNITNNSLPSRVNYYLSLPADKDNTNILLYTIKFIESYYLGLNFLGQTQPLDIIPNMTISRRVLQTHYNLFNFDNHLDGAGNIEITPFQFFYTHNNRYFNRPTTIMNVINTLLNTETNLNKLINILVQKLLSVFININQNKGTDLYATAISYLYPDLLILNNYSKIFESINKTFQSYKSIFNEIKRASTIDININLTNFQIFRLNRFQSIINQINGYIYLLHYFTSKDAFFKIPSFIYHTLGNDKPLIIFNYGSLDLYNPDSNTGINNPDLRVNTTPVEYKGHINRDIGFFSNVINNIGYTTKQTLRREFKRSKNSKLPPSLSVVLTDFYRLNIIETIKNDTIEIDPTIINADINPSNKSIQLLYLKSKIIEELIKLYIKNKIHKYSIDIYNRIFTIMIPKIDLPDSLPALETFDFTIDLNKPPSKDLINNLDITKESGLKLYYSFVESKKIKKQFYIYPDNYFGSNLLKTKYTININLDIIELMLQNNSNILLHNNEKLSPLVMMIKNNYYKAFKKIKDNFDMSSYDNDNYNSPQYYVMENFKNHLDNYYKKMSENQHTEMINIIQSNESYNNNILKYMDVSFNVVKYIVHQYLTENMIRFSDDFNSESLKKILALLNFDNNNINDIGKCQYNENLGSNIEIENADEGIIIYELMQELNKKIHESNKILIKYEKERGDIVGLNMNTTNIDNKITTITNNILSYKNQFTNLIDYYSAKFSLLITQPNINQIKIISRYDNLSNTIVKICYMKIYKRRG
jgi:hypothetical protein